VPIKFQNCDFDFDCDFKKKICKLIRNYDFHSFEVKKSQNFLNKIGLCLLERMDFPFKPFAVWKNLS
jgi:hypothetical protein